MTCSTHYTQYKLAINLFIEHGLQDISTGILEVFFIKITVYIFIQEDIYDSK